MILSLLLFTLTPLLPQSPDLILVGGKVVTIDDAKPSAEAIAIDGDKILAVGSNEEIRALAGEDTRVISLDGQLVLPGFIDGHAHLTGLGVSKMQLDLTKAKSWSDIERQVAEAVKHTPKGQWILGRGWHQEKWSSAPQGAVDGYPTHQRLSALSPDHPVLLTHASGHMCFANEAAMRAAGVDGNTPPTEGGEILHGPDGEPCGVFRETATDLIWAAYEPPESTDSVAYTKRAIQLAVNECLSKGITSFQDAGSTFETIKILKAMASQDELGMRLWVMVRDDPKLMANHLAEAKVHRAGNNFLTVGGLKLVLDGALGAHGAWLLQPYQDLPESSGLNTAPLSMAKQYANWAVQHDLQLCVHAIGDRANREILNVIEQTFAGNPSPRPRRWRIEHAQHLDPADIPRFAKLDVIASMQGVHCTSDGVFVLQRLGKVRSAEGAYVWRKLIEAGALICNGTDAPVEDVDPIANFYASVTRRMPNGETFFPDQKLTRMEALRTYTYNCAYAAFEEDIKGSLTPGKLADIVVLSKDILTCPEEEILDAKVVYTLVGGKVAYTGQ